MSDKRTLAQKLLEVQRKIGAVTKSSTNPHFKSRYADLNEVLDVAKEALNIEGLFIAQGGDHDAGGPFIRTSLIDADSGQTMEGKVYLVGTPDMQKMGAAITYARRFGLVSLLALESEDDDGEAAVGRGTSPGTYNSIPAQSSVSNGSSGVKARPDSKGSMPVQPPVPSGFNREACLQKISLTSKVIIDSKRDTLENLKTYLWSYHVKDKTELTDAQAMKFLTQLEEKLK